MVGILIENFNYSYRRKWLRDMEIGGGGAVILHTGRKHKY